VALTRLSLVCDDLELGRLVRLFPDVPPLETDLAYYVVCERGASRRPVVASFRHWLWDQAESLRRLGL
jgi:LysR family glycine cleavage system transcriptional activator